MFSFLYKTFVSYVENYLNNKVLKDYMAKKTTDIENGFYFDGSFSDVRENISVAKVSIPFKKVKELDLLNKKFRVTVELIDENE